MKTYILTESQLRKVLDSVISEQTIKKVEKKNSKKPVKTSIDKKEKSVKN